MAAHDLDVQITGETIEIIDENDGLVARVPLPADSTAKTDHWRRTGQIADSTTDTEIELLGLSNARVIVIVCDGDLTVSLFGTGGNDLEVESFALLFLASDSGIADGNFFISNTSGAAVNYDIVVLE